MFDTAMSYLGPLRRAAARGHLAPSVHNTQPWRFVIAEDHLDVVADWDRQLHVLDPAGRQLILSCGCAVFNARVALAAEGFVVAVAAFPEPRLPDLVARIAIAGLAQDPDPIASLDPVVEVRRTNRRQFESDHVPPSVVDQLVAAARAEGAELLDVVVPEQRDSIARWSRAADLQQISDPAYRAELRAWTTDDPTRRDGVAAWTVPHVDAGTDSELPLRDFDSSGHGGLPVSTGSAADETLLLLCTNGDNPWPWLRAGQALERVLLEATRQGYVASPVTQVIEVRRTRAMIVAELGLQVAPQILLRVGRAWPTPASRRRRLADVLTDLG
ncbi:MAG: nitroreductase [Actinomycetota bacterium]|nr:MAG: nitroreductase [Actinomycetota bacterium]